MSEVIIRTCKNCPPHPYQDAKYGAERRVMNQTITNAGSPKKYRCTVCGKESGE